MDKGDTQKAVVIEALLKPGSSVEVQALAGTGKTYLVKKACAAIKRQNPRARILVVTFAKVNQRDAVEQFKKEGIVGCEVVTAHSFGFKAVRGAWRVQLEDDKDFNIASRILNLDAEGELLSPVLRLVALGKNHLVVDPTPEALEELALEYDIFVNGDAGRIFQVAAQVLKASIAQVARGIINFDDMVSAPGYYNLSTETYDFVFVDEAQDLNPAQHDLVMRAAGKTGRVVFVGDPRQAMYRFRGATDGSMTVLKSKLEASGRTVATFPLTFTRRCPKKVVGMAKSIVPEFEALAEAPEGAVHDVTTQQLMELAGPGDMVLSRTNAPMVSVAYGFIRAGKKAKIQGRKFGAGLISLVKRLGGKNADLVSLLKRLDTYEAREREKLSVNPRKNERKLQELEDKCATIRVLVEEADDVADLLKRMEALFDDVTNSGRDFIVLSTVHRAKGLEAQRVFIIRPDLMPFPMAKSPAQMAEEANIAYVAVTRAKQELFFVDGRPAFFPEAPKQEGGL